MISKQDFDKEPTSKTFFSWTFSPIFEMDGPLIQLSFPLGQICYLNLRSELAIVERERTSFIANNDSSSARQFSIFGNSPRLKSFSIHSVILETSNTQSGVPIIKSKSWCMNSFYRVLKLLNTVRLMLD